MLGATLGFLVYNFPPATIFMGDAGSQFLGFMFAIISLLGFKNITFKSFLIPLIILAIPIFDTIFAILRRVLKGESIGTPDKEHFHHQLLKLKFSTKTSILLIYAIDIAFSAVTIFITIGDNKIASYLYICLMFILFIMVLKTDILFKHKKNNNK